MKLSKAYFAVTAIVLATGINTTAFADNGEKSDSTRDLVGAESNSITKEKSKLKVVDVTNDNNTKDLNNYYNSVNLKPNTENTGVGLIGGDLSLDLSKVIVTSSSEATLNGDKYYSQLGIQGDIIVSDYRYSAEGWHLSMTPKLTNKNNKEVDGEFNFIIKPSLTEATDSTLTSFKEKENTPTVSPDLLLRNNTSETITVVEAYRSEGLGKWEVDFGNSGTCTLLIPKAVAEKEKSLYLSLTWDLVSGPAY